MEELKTETQSRIVPTIFADWRRFSSGLWRVPEGDISAAYSAESFPKVKTFSHGGITFTNLGTHFSKNAVNSAVDAYPLILPGTGSLPEKAKYSYQGEKVRCAGREFHLGLKVIFQSTDPTISEWQGLLRVLYADGGYFASQDSFKEFLAGYVQEEGNIAKAAALEINEKAAACSKSEILNLLTLPPRETVQMDLFK